MIPYGRQDISQDDIDEVISVLKSDFITQGPCVPRFEDRVASYVNVKHALAVNSATSALHIACIALGLSKDDWLWTSAITFVASSNCGLYCGAKIDFIDIDLTTFNICPQALEERLIYAEKRNILPKVIVIPHMCGQSSDMEKIFLLSKKFNFKIIEDASHAIGGKYKNEAIGNCRYSDITVFSFHPVKIITTAEGGMTLTNNEELYQKMLLLRSHGITRDIDKMTQVSDGPWYYEQIALGYNYRMTELQAALGFSQMNRLDDFVSRRNDIAKRYNEMLKNLPVITPFVNLECYSTFHLYVLRLKLENIKKTHRQIFEKLRELGIGVNLHYIPVYRQPFYQKMGFRLGHCPQAEKYYQEAISIPMFSDLSKIQQDLVVEKIKVAIE